MRRIAECFWREPGLDCAAAPAGCVAIIGECGHEYGIPFTVQLRSSFGTTGVKIPGVLRGLPAIVRFGYQSWV